METKHRNIPLWFRLLPAFFLAVSSGAWLLARVRPAREYAGLAHENVLTLLLAVMLTGAGATVLFLFFLPMVVNARSLSCVD